MQLHCPQPRRCSERAGTANAHDHARTSRAAGTLRLAAPHHAARQLGLDPYQRAAIRCARQVCALLCLLGACLVFAHRYAKPGSNEWVTRTAVDATTGDHLFYFGCFAVACAALICLMVRNKLVVEDLTWRDII